MPIRVSASFDDDPETTAEGSGEFLGRRTPGWTMFLVSHFHYDPVWWNTQAAYTSDWELLATDGTTRRLWEGNGFALVDAHLDLALRDPDYAFVLAETDYLKPYFDTRPERRADLKQLLAEGRLELVGGTYNEPNTNLTGAETTIRNLVYGIGYQRDILGGDPQTAWQLDVFGHDPQFPGYLDDAGLTGSAWARGPFHQWGPIQRNFGDPGGDARLMQFASEFEWIAPSGRGVLTHYMPHHYSAGWWMHSSADLAEAEGAVFDLYRKLKPVGATKNLLLPVGTDYSPPNRWITQVQRSWSQRYCWPRFVCGIPREFLTAVRKELAERDIRPTPQSRDMNPIYTGKDVSYIDTKQAQRSGEVAATDAEKLATAAVLLTGGRYPDNALDKVWRLLAFGAHHDGITGTESDQVYLDLLQNWREAFDLADDVRTRSQERLAAAIDTAAVSPSGLGLAVVVTNTQSFARSDLVEIAVTADHLDGGAGWTVIDDAGRVVVCQTRVGEFGSVVRFVATDVPGFGWRTFCLQPTPGGATDWRDIDEAPGIRNEFFTVQVDPSRGGALSSIVELESGRELLADDRLGNEIRVYEEYPTHPQMGEGPWHLLPRGPVIGSGEFPAHVRRQRGPLGERLIVSGTVAGTAYEQTVTLFAGLDRLEMRTRIADFRDSDRLIRLRFGTRNDGLMPVSEVAAAVVGRGFALPDVDAAVAPWTLDNPANNWFGLSTPARLDLTDASGTGLGSRAFAVVEIVTPDSDHAADVARGLVVALARCGITATTSSAMGSRYGWQHVDSNLPDLRILIGGPGDNLLTAELLDRAPGSHRTEIERQLAQKGAAVVYVPAEQPLTEVWQPNADLRDVRKLGAVVLAGAETEWPRLMKQIIVDLRDTRLTAVTADPAADEIIAAASYVDRTAALVSFGLPGFAVEADGALHLSLMRSCTGWPSGIWLDPPKRTVPDGSGFQLQHWTHDFDYALVAGDGDWRTNRVVAAGLEFNSPLLARLEPLHSGELSPTTTLLEVQPARDVVLSALKPSGNPIAHGRGMASDPRQGVAIRLAETHGLGESVRLTGLLAPDDLERATLLESPQSRGAGQSSLELHGFEVATFLGQPDEPGDSRAAEGPDLGLETEIAQPTYARYWLHNRGPAPMGFLPLSISLDRNLGRPNEDGLLAAEVVVANQRVDEAIDGVVRISVPDGWTAEPAERIFSAAPQGGRRFPVTVRIPGEQAAGVYFLHASCETPTGTVEDVMTVVVGDGGDSRDVLPGEERTPPPAQGQGASAQAQGGPTGLTVDVAVTEVAVDAGQRGAITIGLGNSTQDRISGEIALISPWGSWDLLPEALRGFAVEPGDSVEIEFEIVVAAEHPELSTWALAKVMWFGRVQYSSSVAITVASADPVRPDGAVVG